MSIAQHYHDRTKYHPDTIGQNAPAIDWDRPPLPFKTYKLGAKLDLKPYWDSPNSRDRRDARQAIAPQAANAVTSAVTSSFTSSPSTDVEALSMWQRLSRLLYLTYGITAQVQGGGSQPFLLRTVPSAGGLYPAEVYLISRGTPELPAGLYNYQVQDHSLIRFWESDPWSALQAACFWHPALVDTRLAIVTSAVFFRSAWRYQDRAYRRIHLDTGHLIGNLALACSLTDFRAHAIGGFQDAAIDQLLYLDRETEGAITVFALADRCHVDQNLPSYPAALPSPVETDYPQLKAGDLLGYLHHASEIEREPSIGWETIANHLTEPQQKQYNLPFCTKISTDSLPIDWGSEAQNLTQTILHRRSTRRYRPTAIQLSELNAILDFAYQPHHYCLWNLDPEPGYFDLPSIRTFIAVSAVEGLESGCYYYAPEAQELRQIRFKNFRRELHFLALGQDLGRDAAAVVFHTANLPQAIARFGDRAYRYLHLDAGHLGQRLNLAAIGIGLGASGIAGFFDDHVNEVLGIPPEEAVLYLTTIGQPFRSTP